MKRMISLLHPLYTKLNDERRLQAIMRSLSYDCAPCCYAINLRGGVREKNNNLRWKVPLLRESKLWCVVVKIDHRSGGHSLLDHISLRKLTGIKSVKSIQNLEQFEPADSEVLNANSDSYVVDTQDSGITSTNRGKSVPKLSIPSLNNESKGEDAASISSCFWEWKPKLNVHYEVSGSENVNSPAVLFLPGFGVGTFHYEKQLRDLGLQYRAWTIDFLGQGMSLPVEDPTRQSKAQVKIGSDIENLWGFGDEAEPWASELVYSIDLWRNQVNSFIVEVIKEPVYLVGNSLGGYVALYVAACNPQLVKGVTLLNATPFWGFLPNPTRSTSLSRIFPWAGTFPLPSGVKKLTEILWQKISDPTSITAVLRQVYVDHSIKLDTVFSRIVEIKSHPAAAASFASIMFAPKGELSFNEALKRCQMHNVPICLMYGKEDPWVRPVWGLQVKRQVPDTPYYEISPAGHCPHDETPEVVNFLLRGWIRSLESEGAVPFPLLDSHQSVEHDIIRDFEFSRGASKKVARVKLSGSKLFSWNRLSSYFKFNFQDR